MCELEKNIESFDKKKSEDLLKRKREASKRYKDKNRELVRQKAREFSKNYYWKNLELRREKERTPERKKQKSEWRKENRERINEKFREKYQNDEEFRKKSIKRKVKWEKSNIERVRELKRNHKKKNYEKTKAGHYAYWAKNPEKKKAVQMVNNRINKGTMTKPDKCELCAKKAKVEGHHEDYSKPLDVLWLCKSCHTKIHRGTYLGEEL